ncbi:MAG: formylglycine-generating enzyme family protein [Planctomycetes bacterium]|jgi:formylglycine-generating enzyme required for sulfatase activity|nr:formylglycine-generating enzyme family protein [Planctomycetota bacterium]
MQLNSLRAPVFLSLSLGSLLLPAAAQAPKPTPAAATAATPPAPAAATKPADDVGAEGLPSFLLMVPGGSVEMGLSPDAFVAAACQAASPDKPQNALKVFTKQLTDGLVRSVSMLGRRKVDVAPFYLAKWPVKNKEYWAYVTAKRAAKAKIRAPFHTWRFGCKDDYEAKLPDINKEFPKTENAPLQYWERHGADLPGKLIDDKGKPIDDLPVTFVSWRDANEFAGWLGMRLPSEAEMTRAMRGDGTHTWPTAVPGDAATDVYTVELLKKLQMFNSRDQVLKPVGTVQAAVGPFGHVDLFGQVWQLVGDLGYRPIHGAEVFADEWKKLQKDKVGALLKSPPSWRDDRVVAKGGSYLSFSEPIQLLIDARAPMLTIEVFESLGFRLAKSLKPGYDMLFSLLRGSYNRNPFADQQEVDLAAQIGAERYELAADGFPSDYQAISFAPVNWLSKEKNADLAKLLDRSHTSPLLIGTLATTSALLEPKAPAGLYSVLYRKEGVPKELVDAIKLGHKELKQKAKEDKAKDEPAEEEAGPKKDKKGNWRDITSRFGLTEEDIAAKDAADGNIKFVRIDGIEIPIKDACFLLHSNDGKVAGIVTAPNAKPAVGAALAGTIALGADAKGKAAAKLHFSLPLQQGGKKMVEVQLHLLLDRDAPAADKPWRLPK